MWPWNHRSRSSYGCKNGFFEKPCWSSWSSVETTALKLFSFFLENLVIVYTFQLTHEQTNEHTNRRSPSPNAPVCTSCGCGSMSFSSVVTTNWEDSATLPRDAQARSIPSCGVCLSVGPSVRCPSCSSIVSKWVSISSNFLDRRVAIPFYFSAPHLMAIFRC